MNYTIELSGGKNKFPVVRFDDERYELISEFLIAERGLIGQFLKVLEEIEESNDTQTELSGNAFTVTADNNRSLIRCDIDDRTAESDTSELISVMTAYIRSNVNNPPRLM